MRGMRRRVQGEQKIDERAKLKERSGSSRKPSGSGGWRRPAIVRRRLGQRQLADEVEEAARRSNS